MKGINRLVYYLVVLAILLGCKEKVTNGTLKEAHSLRKAEDYDKAVSIYRYLAIEKDNTEAMFYLGSFYYEGLGVNKDMQESYNWFLRAANGGYSEAYEVLGTMNSNSIHEKNAEGEDMVWLECHPAIVTCEGSVHAAVWWYAKSFVSGNKESIKSIMFEYSNDEQALYAWGMLANKLGVDIPTYNDEINYFKKEATKEQLFKAEMWGQKLISRYGE